MSIKVRLFQSKNNPILVYDKKTRCREVECREGILVQVRTAPKATSEVIAYTFMFSGRVSRTG